MRHGIGDHVELHLKRLQSSNLSILTRNGSSDLIVVNPEESYKAGGELLETSFVTEERNRTKMKFYVRNGNDVYVVGIGPLKPQPPIEKLAAQARNTWMFELDKYASLMSTTIHQIRSHLPKSPYPSKVSGFNWKNVGMGPVSRGLSVTQSSPEDTERRSVSLHWLHGSSFNASHGVCLLSRLSSRSSSTCHELMGSRFPEIFASSKYRKRSLGILPKALGMVLPR